MEKGEEIYDALVELERKLWSREDYSEEDIVTFSNAMDYVESNLEDFKKFFER